MKLLRKIITATYPFRMAVSKITGLGIKIHTNPQQISAPVNFHTLSADLNSGEVISMNSYAGKKILIVNLASQCGYTPQYSELESLHQNRKDLVILGFPANDFRGQEPGNDEEIAAFCKLNFGVSFPIFKKDAVTGKDRQPIYRWLSDPSKNGWNDQAPGWNFFKYLIDENGNLSKVSSSSVAPNDSV